MHSNKMLCMMLLSTILGITGGIWFPELMLNMRWIDTLFINLLKLIAIPLIVCALVNTIVLMSNTKRLNLVWIYTGLYVLMSVSIAVAIGLILSNFFNPGGIVSSDLINLYGPSSPLEAMISTSPFFNTMLPLNKINIAANLEFIPLIVFSIIFGIACISIGKPAKPIIKLFAAIHAVFIKISSWLMYVTPIALFGLFGYGISEAYTKHLLIDSITGLSFFIGIFLFGLLCQFIWQLAIVIFIIRRSTKAFLKNCAKALLMALATSNALSTLPMAILVAKEEQIDEDIVNLVLPFSTIINLAGTAMYEAVSTLFICQILNIHLSILSQIGIFFIAMLAGIGAGSIPEGRLITMVIVLRSINVPTSAILLLLPFDPVLGRLRTAIDVWGDLVCALTVDHFILKKKPIPLSVHVIPTQVKQLVLNLPDKVKVIG